MATVQAAVAGLAIMLFTTFGFHGALLADAREDLIIVTGSGEHRFTVEIADTDALRARGLMFRRSLPQDEGMLFVHEGEEVASMWMRNTYISLDMIFIRADGSVHRIERDTEPFSERVISSGAPVAAVLELVAGSADRIGLKPGDRIVSPRFEP